MSVSKPHILLAAKRGHNFRHLERIRRDGGLDAELRMAGGIPGIPALDRRARRACPLEEMLAVHLSRRRADRPWMFSTGLVRVPYLALLHTYTRWLFLSWVRALRARRPSAVVLWNGHRMPESAVRAAARFLGVRVIHVENGCLPNTRTVDPEGVNDFNSVPRDPSFYRKLGASQEEHWELVPRNWHRSKSVPRDDERWLPERFVFAPFQVDTDSQLVLHSPWIRDMRHFYEVLVDARAQLVAQHPDMADLHIIFKEHPSSPYYYEDLHERASGDQGVLFRNPVSTQELLERSTAIVTINSTAGIEGLLFGKPVITLGSAFYNIDGLVLHAGNDAQLRDALGAIPGFVPDEAVRRGLVTYLRDSYCVPKDPARNGEDDWTAMAARIRTLSGGEASMGMKTADEAETR